MLLAIFNAKEQKRFDHPSRLTAALRQHCFDWPPTVAAAINRLRTPTNKVGFVLQYGYFIATQRFYIASRFHEEDIQYVIEKLEVDPAVVNLAQYQKKIPIDHQKTILTLCECLAFDAPEATKQTNDYLATAISQYASPKTIFMRMVKWLHEAQIESPSYHALAALITEGFRHYEKNLLAVVDNALTSQQKAALDTLLFSNDKQPSLFNRLKYINHSTQPKAINAHLDLFEKLQLLFLLLEPAIEVLPLSRSARQYYVTWMQKAKLSQVQQFPQLTKRYFHLLVFVQDQYYLHQDALVDILLKCVQSAKSTSARDLKLIEGFLRPQQTASIKLLRNVRIDDKAFIAEVRKIMGIVVMTHQGKCDAIEELLINYDKKYDEETLEEIKTSENLLDNIDNDADHYASLEKNSVKLQNRVAKIVQVLLFNEKTSDEKIINAIDYYQQKGGDITASAPTFFMREKDKQQLKKENGQFRPSLYKILFFIAVADGIKSGDVNLRHTYRYKAIQDYLIDCEEWRQRRDELLEAAGLSQFVDADTVLDKLKTQLHDHYEQVNIRFNTNKNPYLSIDKQQKVLVRTPATSDEQEEHIATLLGNVNYVSLLQILTDVNQAAHFTEAFEHFSVKHSKTKPSLETFFAGLVAQGCNIGVEKLAHTWKGILENTLKNTVKWYFSLKNLQTVNNEIVAMIQQLSLSSIFVAEKGKHHTASDGRKVVVAVDSLIANYSFKYFGKDKGVSVYTFIDERQSLFYSSVFSASEREAAYVLDGLLDNDVVRSDMHSSDTHGFTETVFGTSHFIQTAYAPRIKNIGRQTLYAFSSKQYYADKGYQILPSRTINVKLIKEHWDDILRFMATILLKRETASQLFKRLSSYAKENPLYKALKEFGRIIKSLFILQYYDDVKLRQRIEKQLNRIELSNKFGRAIFFDNNGEFQKPSPEEQAIITACQVVIQNAIVLWNYLYLSQLLVNIDDPEERQTIIDAIRTGSVLAWRHVNLIGAFDFRGMAANSALFDMDKIFTLEVA